MTDHAADWRGINNELVVEFFYMFSRFEYALKRAGFLKRKPNEMEPHAEPNWDTFANAIAPDCPAGFAAVGSRREIRVSLIQFRPWAHASLASRSTRTRARYS